MVAVQLLAVSWLVLAQGASAPSREAQAAFSRGELALAKNQLDEAVAAYRLAVSLSPNDGPAHNGLGSVLFKQGKVAEAVAAFEKATQVAPDFKLGWFNLGYASRKANDPVTAARAYARYLELEPEDADGAYGLAESYRMMGEREKAVRAYERFITLEKRPSEQAWVERARAQLAELRSAPAPDAGGNERSAAGSSTGAKRGPGMQKVADGDALFAQKRYRDASFAYQEAVEMDPDFHEARFKLSQCYAVLGAYPDAIDGWRRVLAASADPDVRRNAQENIAKAQAKMAAVDLKQSPSARDPQRPGAWVSDAVRAEARTHYEEGVRRVSGREYDLALQRLTQAIELDPGFAVAFVARGSANIGLRRYADAVKDYQEALKLEPTLGSPLYGMAEAYRGLGRTADARVYYERYAGSRAPDVRSDLVRESRQKADSLR